jgi:DNA polymerase-1
MKDRVIDLATVRETFSLEPAQMIDVMGLSGDTADNVPGVPGIGPKTGQALIREFGSMDRLYEQLESLTKKKQREKLAAHTEQAFLSRSLVTIDTEAPVALEPEALRRMSRIHVVLADLFQELEFRQLHQQFAATVARWRKALSGCHGCRHPGGTGEHLAAAERWRSTPKPPPQTPCGRNWWACRLPLHPTRPGTYPADTAISGRPASCVSPRVITALKPVLENAAVRQSRAEHQIRLDGAAQSGV